MLALLSGFVCALLHPLPGVFSLFAPPGLCCFTPFSITSAADFFFHDMQSCLALKLAGVCIASSACSCMNITAGVCAGEHNKQLGQVP